MNIYKPLAKYVPLYLAVLEVKGRKQSTVKTYRDRLKIFFSQDLSLDQYLADVAGKNSTIYTGFIELALDRYFYWLQVNGFIREHPHPNYKPTKWWIPHKA